MDRIAGLAHVLQVDGPAGAVLVPTNPRVGVVDAEKPVALADLDAGRELLVQAEEVALRVRARPDEARQGAVGAALLRGDAATSGETARLALHYVQGQVHLGVVALLHCRGRRGRGGRGGRWRRRGLLRRLRHHVHVVEEAHGVDNVDVGFGLPDVVDLPRLDGDVTHDDVRPGVALAGLARLRVEEPQAHLGHLGLLHPQLGDVALHVGVRHLAEDALVLVPLVQAP
mmetsp:Transcript_3616/g.9053  ORF Transcript_3616/g.9053 Transcript_3616/m.9053 type:complete len:228 (+) Transcript_3616:874-1557(+)